MRTFKGRRVYKGFWGHPIKCDCDECADARVDTFLLNKNVMRRPVNLVSTEQTVFVKPHFRRHPGHLRKQPNSLRAITKAIAAIVKAQRIRR